jgi:integrase
MKHLIPLYLEDMKYAWAESSRARLNGLADLMGQPADKVWDALVARGMKPYARVTTWARLCTFITWALGEGHYVNPKGNIYAHFRKKNARLFKHCYEKKVPTANFEDTKTAILCGLTDPDQRGKALDLLNSGMRYTESTTFDGERVIGKGGKPRNVYLATAAGARYAAGYRSFLRNLKQATGLKPHDLRKIFLNHVLEVNPDCQVQDLQEIAGWASPTTAASYIKAKEAKVRRLVTKAQGGAEDGNVEVSESVRNGLKRVV